ncbi:hypothetical protein BGZ49_007266 [Haplosporangium sp. Z 27]|nr:hypothetical protein BGZ49_007266 [Haplosporangium sp. Z 27]
MTGIITVNNQDLEQEDEALVALREIPKFEPLVVPDQPSHFSLASVFGALSTGSDSSHGSTDMTFSPSVLVDMLIQLNVHNKQCAQDIQGFQRALAQKVKALDIYTVGAVQILTGIQQQAKSRSDHLLSVHAIAKQAHTTTTLLHGIIEKINYISENLPEEAGVEAISSEKYPNLYRYLHQTPSSTGQGQASGSADASSSRDSGLLPSGLALWGHNPGSKAWNPTMQYSTKTATTSSSVQKARASMALAPSTLTYLSMDAISEQNNDGRTDNISEMPSTPHRVPRSLAAGSQGINSDAGQPQTVPKSSQPTLKASDNLRRLASKN